MQQKNSKQLTYAALLATNLAAIGSIYYFWPGLRFEYTPANYIIFAALHISLPIIIFLLARISINQGTRFIFNALAFVILLPAVFLAISALNGARHSARSGHDPSLQPIAHIKHLGSHYKLYRTQANPNKAHGLVLRKETPLLANLKYVEDIKGFYGTKNGSLEMFANKHIKVTTEPYNSYYKTEVFEFSP